MEIQVLDSFARLSKAVQKIAKGKSRLISRASNVTFLEMLYLTFYERIGSRIEPIARELCGNKEKYYAIGAIIQDLKRYDEKTCSVLFESMKNHVRNSIAHGTYIINQKKGEIKFTDDERTETYTFQSFDDLLLDIRTLLFAIYLGYVENYQKILKNFVRLRSLPSLRADSYKAKQS